MNGRKMRNRQIYFATHKTASAQLSATLSKDLRKKYHKRSARVVEAVRVKVHEANPQVPIPPQRNFK